jgi:glutathione synthase/RimK-type ligase-like ATP-grasp enzyme
MILLWGLPHDPPLRAIADALIAAGAPIFVLDQRHANKTSLALSVTNRAEGHVVVGDALLQLETVTAAYIRPHGPDGTRLLGSERAREQALSDALLLWAEIAEGIIVVNRPSAMATNGSKPYQLAQIADFGLATPKTLLTTSPPDVQAFAAQHEQVIYKSTSGIRSIVSRFDADARQRLDDVRWCPTQFQEFISGTDYRVHVVGNTIFAATIESAADDYRYADGNDFPIVHSARLPEDVEDRCRELAARSNLALAGIDLRCTPDGSWYCFEVNPSPAFTYYEERTEQPIAVAVAALLAAADATTAQRD